MIGLTKAFTVLTDILDLFLPDLCLLCNVRLIADEPYLCNKCWNLLPIFPDRSGTPIRPLRGVLDRLWIAWDYDDSLRQLIHLFKYKSRPELAARFVAEWIKAIPHPETALEVDIIVPVPVHPARLRMRGFNQSDLLASCLADRLNIEHVTSNAIRVINTPSQTQLEKGQRWKSVQDAFDVINPEQFRQARVLIMDDLVTTGATIFYLAEKLQECSPASVSAAVLASPHTGDKQSEK